MHRSRGHRRRGRKPTAAGGARSSACVVLSDTASAREVLRPFFLLPYCAQIRPAAVDIPTNLRYKFFESGLALLPQIPTCLHVHLFLLPSALPNPPKFLLLLEVKLLHAFESRALFKQRRKGESCSMNLGLDSKRK